MRLKFGQKQLRRVDTSFIRLTGLNPIKLIGLPSSITFSLNFFLLIDSCLDFLATQPVPVESDGSQTTPRGVETHQLGILGWNAVAMATRRLPTNAASSRWPRRIRTPLLVNSVTAVVFSLFFHFILMAPTNPIKPIQPDQIPL